MSSNGEVSRLKKYTDPAFFFNIWAAELMKKIDKANEQIDNKKVQQLSSLELLIIFVQLIKSSKSFAAFRASIAFFQSHHKSVADGHFKEFGEQI